MSGRLLDRQSRLLEYLTSGEAIFRDEHEASADFRLDAELQGIERGLLDLEARFSHEKRMEKIIAVFPKTLELVGDGRDALLRRFAEACPPQAIGRVENARQLYDHLREQWRGQPPMPPHLPDVAACELACAVARVAADFEPAPDTAPRPGIRRRRGVALVRTAYDVRAVFEGDRTAPVRRETLLAIALKDGEPQIFELTPEVHDLLAALDEWAAADELPGADGLIAELAEAGLLELRR